MKAEKCLVGFAMALALGLFGACSSDDPGASAPVVNADDVAPAAHARRLRRVDAGAARRVSRRVFAVQCGLRRAVHTSPLHTSGLIGPQ